MIRKTPLFSRSKAMRSSKIAIKDNTLRRLTGYASIFVALTLIGVKCGAYFMTDSVALLSSLIDSGVDLIASVITAYGVVIAMRPPDREHRFGHGKAESLAALAQAVFILISVAALLYKAMTRFAEPVQIQNTDIGYGVMGFAIVLTLILLGLQTYTIRRTKSLAIASDRLHYVGDVFINGAVIVTFALQAQFDVLWVDPLFAVVIALILAIGAYKIARMALPVLMDAELSTEERQNIIGIMAKVQGVKGVHDVRTREDSGKILIEAHIEMNARITLLEAHVITEAVEAAVAASYKNVDILIHQDPFGHKEKRLDNIIAKNDPV